LFLLKHSKSKQGFETKEKALNPLAMTHQGVKTERSVFSYTLDRDAAKAFSSGAFAQEKTATGLAQRNLLAKFDFAAHCDSMDEFPSEGLSY